MNRITIFHYHLLPGGVTNVILLGAKALIRHFPNLQLLRIVCGTTENTDKIRSTLLQEIDASGLIADSLKFEICIEPEIGYSTYGEKLSSSQEERLSRKLLDKYGDSFWWIHNYQLGKNPLFTAAVVHISKNIPEQKMLLHIHDFPECARYDNLEKLKTAGVENPYPQAAGIAYCVINSRDESILKEAGLTGSRVYLLNNPVEEESSAQAAVSVEETGILKKRLYSCYSNTFPGINPEAKMIFYPVRTIRRKNALEAGLIAAVSELPVNLIISLPGVSAQEKAYSELCESCFRQGLIPGIWGSGSDSNPDVPAYPIMLQLCDMILSSSVQEGFGYLFINSVQLGKPLMARNLDILSGISGVFPPESTYFYKGVYVPVNKTDAKAIRNRYTEKLSSLGDLISEDVIESVRTVINSLGNSGVIDFSFLPVELQADILARVKNSEKETKEIHDLNKNLMAGFYRLLKTGNYKSAGNDGEFSLNAHSKTVEHIINELYNSNAGSDIPLKISNQDRTIQQNLLDRFAEPEYMRLLYDF